MIGEAAVPTIVDLDTIEDVVQDNAPTALVAGTDQVLQPRQLRAWRSARPMLSKRNDAERRGPYIRQTDLPIWTR